MSDSTNEQIERMLTDSHTKKNYLVSVSDELYETAMKGNL